MLDLVDVLSTSPAPGGVEQHLALIHTGGTFSSQYAPQSGGVMPQHAPRVPTVPDVRVTDFGRSSFPARTSGWSACWPCVTSSGRLDVAANDKAWTRGHHLQVADVKGLADRLARTTNCPHRTHRLDALGT